MKLRIAALAALFSLATSTVGCGYILYPQRRGNHGGTMDGGTLVMDLLWLIPGVVPGVVFLIVDFSSGAMYVNGRYAMTASPQGNVAVHLNDGAIDTTLELRVVTASGRVIDDKTTQIGPSIKDRSVELHVGTSRHETLFMQVLDPREPTKVLQQLALL